MKFALRRNSLIKQKEKLFCPEKYFFFKIIVFYRTISQLNFGRLNKDLTLLI